MSSTPIEAVTFWVVTRAWLMRAMSQSKMRAYMALAKASREPIAYYR
jgi:hypothetical protein